MVSKLLRYAGNYVALKRTLRTPLNLILYVTNKCNMRCEHCFYWKELNKGNNILTLAQIEQIAKSLKHKLNVLLITGGEPFMRNDMGKICRLFVKYNKVNKINIATNGFFTNQICSAVEQILKANRNLALSIQISIDSLHGQHDILRGMQGAFQHAVATVNKLKQLKNKYGRLSIAILSVLSNRNYKDIDPLATHIRENLGVRHSFELVRGSDFSMFGGAKEMDVNPKSKDVLLPPQEQFDSVFKAVRDSYKKQTRWLISTFGANLAGMLAAMDILKHKKKIVDCLAGNSVGVIYENGDVALCELHGKIGNLSDYGWDFDAIWNSEKAYQKRRLVKNCFCTHGCFLQPSLVYAPCRYLKYLRRII